MSDGGAATFSSHIQTNFLKLENAQISQTSGDLTLDVAGDITLDADGADIKFSDGGSHFFSITKSSTHALLHNPISNGDIQIKGLDDGSAITAITIDMSEAGNTTFNADVTVGGNLTVQGTTTTLNTATSVSYTHLRAHET